ncbi:MAG: tol-pal system protein YbgF [Tahibacter sp.]
MRAPLKMFRASITAAVALVAIAAVPLPAAAQRLSLAERVAKLELLAQAGQGNVDLVNQIQSLQSEVQQLQGKIEEMRHQLDEQKERNKQQYIDLDSRLGRLEGGGAGHAPAANNGQLDDIQLGAPSSAPVNGTTTAPATTDAADAGFEPVQQEPAPVRNPSVASIPASAATPVIDAGSEKASYDEAFAALKDGRYAESARRFQIFIDQHPTSDLTANAYYWLGESYYVTQNYRVSLDTFQTLLKQYPDSQKAPDALLKTGYCQYELKQWAPAEATLNRVVQKYPDTTVARLAQGRLRALKLEGVR